MNMAGWEVGRNAGPYIIYIYTHTYVVIIVYYSFRSKKHTYIYILTDNELELIDLHGGSWVVFSCDLCNDIKDEVWELECGLHIGHQS